MDARMEEVKAQVEAFLGEVTAKLPKGELTDAMHYACVGGKKVRAFLVMEFGAASRHRARGGAAGRGGGRGVARL